ncbi:50S ribosomal protein L25 [Alkaliphilus hydrothermalis]|uniref:Large ribosomal subunit protein bL25 n=1 Tax=Alkaliphilus hydrothermalis TaxID=1482730 RepID=A0ABS2NP32_9FIRM|nr:50S ribosomal protein L25 [Alkaliphilus hydrothermalis]MBM7614700.1 large subunit ribosomal protein L25 [Alkaliphilus hydrothermalis]
MQSITSEVRNNVGKNESHRVRFDGYVPSVIYGRNMNTVPIKIDKRELQSLLRNHGENGIIQVEMGGENHTVLIKEVQRDPVTKEIIHLDLQQVSYDQKIHVKVPIVLKGRNYVERGGVILQQQLQELEVECFAGNIPQKLEYDVTSLTRGDALRVADMEFGEEFHIIQDPQSIIASFARVEKALDEVVEE